jgi:hypothetical protein
MMPIISESTLGGGYGDHIEDALMANDVVLRTDIPCIIFYHFHNIIRGETRNCWLS